MSGLDFIFVGVSKGRKESICSPLEGTTGSVFYQKLLFLLCISLTYLYLWLRRRYFRLEKHKKNEFSFCFSLTYLYLCQRKGIVMINDGRPRLAIVDPNTLATIGLKQLLQNVMPIMTVDTFGSFAELEANGPDNYYHFFVAMNLVLENRSFFLEHRRKTIVLTMSNDPSTQLKDFHSLCINVPENILVRSLLMLGHQAHAGGKNLPPLPRALRAQVLTDREIEVLALIVQGYINKEIADQLNIGLTTVITHRKNIMEKLGMKSVSALTIYAVMHGYVDINKI